MALKKLKSGCPYGKEIAEEIEKGGNAGIETRLAAKDTDNGKTLQIDSNGKVALVTV